MATCGRPTDQDPEAAGSGRPAGPLHAPGGVVVGEGDAGQVAAGGQLDHLLRLERAVGEGGVGVQVEPGHVPTIAQPAPASIRYRSGNDPPDRPVRLRYSARLPTSSGDEEVGFPVSLLMLAVVALFPVLLLGLLLVTNGLEGRGVGSRKARSGERRTPGD